MINSENYVGHVLRTDCVITQELMHRLTDPETVRLLHAAMGMTTEAAELMDMLKKHLFYGKKLDIVNAIEELGDNQWYVGLAVDVLRTTMNEIMTINIDKLRLRYPEKFNGKDAIERNFENEREFLENAVAVAVESSLSQRGLDWIEFSAQVLAHIENYTVVQYGDKGEDQATAWTIDELVNQIKKYAQRQGRNSREGQDELDLLKIAHYAQMVHEKRVPTTEVTSFC